MEGLGVAASLLTIIELSAKVATLCAQYAKDVASARDDIQRLQNQVSQLEFVLRRAKCLAEGPRGKLLVVSQWLTSTIVECVGDLRKLEDKLSPKPARQAMRRLGLRALKWPFMSQEVNQLLSSLERYEKAVLLGLQVDQTAMIVDIHEGVRNLSIQATEDASISRKPHYMLPFTPDPDFIHRSTLWDWIRDQYTQSARRMALVGMGGFGKSQLAIQFAHQVHSDSPDTSIFWVHGNSKETFEESYRALADVLALPRRHEPKVNVLALVRDWLQSSDVSAWFMVVDNADDVTVFFAKDDHAHEPLASYLPKTAKGKILITSRSLDAAEKLTGSERTILRIPIMEEEQALHLLRKKLDQEADEATARSLVCALEHIPLAVNQAAAYINRRSPLVTPKSYLADFRRSEKRRDGLLRSDGGDLGRPDDASNPIVLTWQVTFEQIRREKPRAANLLSLMSCFQAQNIPENLLHGYEDVASEEEVGSKGSGKSPDTYTDTDANTDEVDTQENFENDIDVLRGYSLITPTAPGLYEMHSLVQFCTRSWISEFGDRRRWARLFIQVTAEHFPSGEFETWKECQRLLPHVEAVVASKPKLEGDLLGWSRLLTNVSGYMMNIGEYARAEEMAKKAVQVRKDALGAGHPSTLKSLALLTSTFEYQGWYEEAEKLGLEVLETRKAKLGIDHPDTLISLSNLAVTFLRQDRYEEAERLDLEVLETRKAKLGVDHPDTLISMGILAYTWKQTGRHQDALVLLQDCVSLQQKKLGLTHPDTQFLVKMLKEWRTSICDGR